MSHVLSTSSTQLGQGPAVLRPILLFHRFRFLTLGSNVYLVFPLLMCVLSHVWLFATLQTVACQAPLPLGFPKKEYWSELPFPDSGDLPDSGFEPMSLASSWLKVWTHVSCISHTGRQILYHCATWKAQAPFSNILKKKKSQEHQTFEERFLFKGQRAKYTIKWKKLKRQR